MIEDKKAIEDRLTMLGKLESGWLGRDMYGEPPTPAALQRAREVLLALHALGVPRPPIYPTPTSDIQVEWSVGPWEIEIVFKADGQTIVGEADCMNDPPESPSRVLSLSEGDVAAQIKRWLVSMIGELDDVKVWGPLVTEPTESTKLIERLKAEKAELLNFLDGMTALLLRQGAVCLDQRCSLPLCDDLKRMKTRIEEIRKEPDGPGSAA